jgi:hypothetical protein
MPAAIHANPANELKQENAKICDAGSPWVSQTLQPYLHHFPCAVSREYTVAMPVAERSNYFQNRQPFCSIEQSVVRRLAPISLAASYPASLSQTDRAR